MGNGRTKEVLKGFWGLYLSLLGAAPTQQDTTPRIKPGGMTALAVGPTLLTKLVERISPLYAPGGRGVIGILGPPVMTSQSLGQSLLLVVLPLTSLSSSPRKSGRVD